MQLVIALDMPFSKAESIVEQTLDLEEVRGYKLGFSFLLDLGLRGEKGYYDHFSTGSDIPQTADKFFNILSKHEGIEGVIIGSITGKESLREWIRKAKEYGKDVIYEVSYPHVEGGVDVAKEMINVVMREGVHKFALDDSTYNSHFFSYILLGASMYEEINILHRTSQVIEGVQIVNASSIMEKAFREGKKLVKRIMEGGKEVIYDHQKAGMSAYESIDTFVNIAKKYVDKIISFPLFSHQHEERWINKFKGREERLIIGGEMTHPGFMREEGGYFTEQYINSIYSLAHSRGIRDFVMPGNKPQRIYELLSLILSKNQENNITPSSINIYSPGFISQGGEIKEVQKTLKPLSSSFDINLYPIVGRAVYERENVRDRIKEIASKF